MGNLPHLLQVIYNVKAIYWSLLAFAALSNGLVGQTITQPFTGSTAPGWVLGGNTYTPVLTSGGVDPANNGWLRLTDNVNARATYAYYDTAVSSANRTVFTSFDFASYNGTGADGLTFFLFDGSANFSVGAYGGSMGYAPKTIAGGAEINQQGLAGGYLAISLDDFGNFSNATEGRTGGIGANPNAIAVRGPGNANGYDGYEFIAATGDGTNAALTQQMDFPDATTRPSQTGVDYRHVEILLTPTNQLTVWIQFGAAGGLTKVLEADLSGYLRPETLKFGFTSGTGSANEIHELRALTVATLVANLWDNGANGGSSATGDWSTAANWNPDVPVTGDDILFDNTFVSTNQTVNVGASTTRVIRSIQIDAPFSYTLNNGTLDFNSNGVPGFTGIAVTQTNGVSSTGNTINSAIKISTDAGIRNSTTSTLTLTGAINTNGKTLTVDGAGAVVATGIISGSGKLVKDQAGNLTLSGANTYSGGTTISGGVVTLGHNTALGSGAVVMTGGSLAGSGTRTIANAVALQGNAGFSNLTVSGAVSQTGGDRTLTLDGATISGGVTLAENNQARTLTTHVLGDSTISGVIANGSGSGADGLTKTGSGTLTLSGANTYTGATTINEGAIRLNASDRISDSSNLNLNGGALNLNGKSERVNDLAFNNGTLDFGTTGTTNALMFNNDGTAGGPLSVLNWESATDKLAYRSDQTLSSTFLANIYFSGYGSGAEVLAANQDKAISGYGGSTDWDFITPLASTFYTWDGRNGTTTGSDDDWTTGDNWIGNTQPGWGTTTRIAFADNGTPTTRQTTDMDGDKTVNAIRFNADNTKSYILQGNDTLTMGGTLPSIMQLSAFNQTLSMEELALGTTTIFDVAGAGNLIISSVITSTAATNTLVKEGTGSGILILSGTNTFTSSLVINGGSVEATQASSLGTGGSDAANTVVNDGGSLRLNTTGTGFTTTERLVLAGQGYGAGGALRNVDGNNTVSGTIALTADARIQSDLDTLTLSNTISGTGKNLSVGGAGNVTITGAITTGAGAALTKDGAGTVTLGGTTANTYTNITTVNAGTLILNKTASINAIAGDLLIGDGTGTDTVQLGANHQIVDTAVVTIANGGVFNVNGKTETIGGLNSASTGSQVQLGAGALTVNNSTANSYAGAITGSGSLTKTGVGRLTLSGASASYTGATNVNAGIVAISAGNALGTGAVNVASGGNVEVQGNISVANTFNITGDGSGASDGAIENFSGANTLTGNVALTGNARIGSSSGTLTLSSAGTLTGTNRNLTVSGAGDTVINRAIATGTGTLTKSGSGTLTLGATNAYTGATTISAGKIVAASTGIFSNTAALTINTAAVYDMAGYSETIGTLQGGSAGQGGSINFGGATLTLASGTSSFGGDFGFTNGTITINAGATLTLTDSFNAANINIVLNGGTLNLGSGMVQSFGSLTVTGSADSIIDFGTTGSTYAEFTSVDVTGSGKLKVSNWSNGSDAFVADVSPGPKGSSPTNKVVFDGYVGNDTRWVPYYGSGVLTPVPEPSTYGAIFLGAAVGLVAMRRRRRA